MTRSVKKDRRKEVIKLNAKAPKWTLSEVEFLKKNCGKLSDEEIGAKIGKTVHAVYCKRRSLKTVKNPRPVVVTPTKEINEERYFKAWTKQEEKFLKDNYNSLSFKNLSIRLGRSVNAIKARASILGLIEKENKCASTRWSHKDISFLKHNINNMSYEELGKALNRSSAAIAVKVSSLKIKKASTTFKKDRKINNWVVSKGLVITSLVLNFGLCSYFLYLILK